MIDAEATQAIIDKNLDHIEAQQGEIAQALDQYERQSREILETGSTGTMRVLDMGPADAERDRRWVIYASSLC
jgi:hypothetical protein